MCFSCAAVRWGWQSHGAPPKLWWCVHLTRGVARYSCHFSRMSYRISFASLRARYRVWCAFCWVALFEKLSGFVGIGAVHYTLLCVDAPCFTAAGDPQVVAGIAVSLGITNSSMNNCQTDSCRLFVCVLSGVLCFFAYPGGTLIMHTALRCKRVPKSLGG